MLKENGLIRFMTMSLRVAVSKGKISQMEVVEDFKTTQGSVLFGKKREGDKGMKRAAAAEGAALSQWRKVARKEHNRERKRRRRGRRGRRRKKDQVSNLSRSGCSKEKVSVHDGDKEAVQKSAGQSFMRSWCCSEIENEEEEESWREGGQIAAQWEEEQKLEEIVERRRIEGSSLKLEVMQNVLEPMLHEQMSQCKGVKGDEK